jgi:hypothetical protein
MIEDLINLDPYITSFLSNNFKTKNSTLFYGELNYIRYLIICDENTIASLILFISFLYGCKSYGPEVDPLKIQENFMDWWTYRTIIWCTEILLVLMPMPRNK